MNATFSDTPRLYDRNFPPGVTKIIMEFEVDAFCAGGEGSGQYLGKTFWLYEIEKTTHAKVIQRDPNRLHDRGQPTTAFLDALAKWGSTRDFAAPAVHAPPPQGGSPCPP